MVLRSTATSCSEEEREWWRRDGLKEMSAVTHWLWEVGWGTHWDSDRGGTGGPGSQGDQAAKAFLAKPGRHAGTRDPLWSQCLQTQLRSITNLSASAQLLTQRTEVLLVYDEQKNPSTLEVSLRAVSHAYLVSPWICVTASVCSSSWSEPTLVPCFKLEVFWVQKELSDLVAQHLAAWSPGPCLGLLVRTTVEIK